jgi:hypothetical protein
MKFLFFILLFSFCAFSEKIGVYNLEPLNISENFVKIVSERIAYEFQQSGYDLIERQEIEKVLAEQYFQNSGVSDSIVQIGKILNVQNMVTGSFGQLDSITWFISLKLINIESGKTKTGYFVVENSFKDFVLNAPKSCVSQIISPVKPQKTSYVSEEKAPIQHINVINYIQKDRPKLKLFTVCHNCSGKGSIYVNHGTKKAGPYLCSVCNGHKYSGPETNYKLLAGKIEEY